MLADRIASLQIRVAPAALSRSWDSLIGLSSKLIRSSQSRAIPEKLDDSNDLYSLAFHGDASVIS